MLIHARAVLLAALFTTLHFASGVCPAAEPPVNIIFDTDMGGDCDDVGALFMLHGAVERGEAKLLATMGCTSSDAIAPCLDAINTWFGRPEIPVGTMKDAGLFPNPGFTAEIVKRFPHKFATGKDYPDSIVLYRQILSKQPDGSVVIVAVGQLRNMANLLKSRPDEASPLDGAALLAKKVKRLDVMGGKYPPFPSKNDKDGESNFITDAPSTAAVCSHWPTPILFNGEGGSTCSGRRATYEMPEHSPLTMSYRRYPGVGFAGDRLSWDPVSVLVSVRGAAPWYKVVSGGVNVADPKTGVNVWKPGEDRGHSYLVLDTKRPKAEVESALEDLMVAGKARPTNLKFNTAYYAEAGMCQITSKGAVDASSAAIKAFQTENESSSGWWDKAASSWLQCRYADGRKSLVHSYAVVCKAGQRLPRSLELSGSNDGGVTWTVLDTRANPAFTEQASRLEFTLAKPAKWNIYRLSVTAANPGEGTQVSAIELNESIHCRPEVAVAGVTLDHQAISLAVDGRATLNASVAPAETLEREVKWVSSDPAVAEVRRIGEQIAMVVGKKPGTCTMTATIGKVQQSCKVTVTPSSLPAGWSFNEINTPPIPGSVVAADGKFTITGCGNGMTLFWERVSDQGAFVSKPLADARELSARLTSLALNVSGPNAYKWDTRPPTISGLMIRESASQPRGRYFLIQVDVQGHLLCRWRDKAGGQEDKWKKDLGKAGLPIHLKLHQTDTEVSVFTSTDGKNWGEPRFTHALVFDDKSRIGLFVCSGNTFSSTTAVFDSVKAVK